MTTILSLAESQQQFEFFSRFNLNGRALGYKFIIVTSKLSIYLLCKISGIECSIVNRSNTIATHKDLTTTGEVVHGFFTEEEASIYYSSFKRTISELYSSNNINLTMIWGGGDTVASHAMVDQAKKNGIQTLFFDKANIPGKIFVDPRGTNYESYLYKNINILDKAKSNEDAFKNYKKRFQSTNQLLGYRNKKYLNWLFPIDLLYSFFSHLPFRGDDQLIKKIFASFSKKKGTPIDSYVLRDGSYIFIPLNHSFEIQKENMSYLLAKELLMEGKALADQLGKDIVVKYHPAENDAKFFDFIRSLQHKYKFFIRNNSSRELISNACTIVASNTSVALEAMLMEKPVVHVGRSIFRELDQKRLSSFITWYLINIDLSLSEPISTEVIEIIIKRTSLV
jgi:capsular polysaccharide export protein